MGEGPTAPEQESEEKEKKQKEKVKGEWNRSAVQYDHGLSIFWVGCESVRRSMRHCL
jgi:hypothetical protein